MKTKLLTAIATVAIFASGYSSAAIRPGESIVRDPVTGDYTATYWDEDETGGEFMTATLVSATKIEPRITASFKTSGNLQVRYSYKISNGAAAKQSIETIKFGLPVDVSISNIVSRTVSDYGRTLNIELFDNAFISPPNWIGSAVRNPGEFTIDWHVHKENFEDVLLGIKPNQTQAGFGFVSGDLPGVVLAKFEGNVGYPGFSAPGMGEGPDPYKTDIAKQMQEIEHRDYVSGPIPAPTVIVPIPFDAALLLDRIRIHVATWSSKQLLDPALATQLDRYLVSAADAYRRNQLKAGKEHIETLREMLKREHQDLDHDDDENENGKRAEKNDDHRAVNQRILIDRLAARILDFDLKYVLKRTEREDDDHKKH
jgi:hypothetical protein